MTAAHHHVHLTVAPVKPPTQVKKVMSKGKDIPCPTTQPHVHKVMWITSPMPEVAKVVASFPPTAGPSQAIRIPLFEEPVGLGDDNVGKEGPMPYGKKSLDLIFQFN